MPDLSSYKIPVISGINDVPLPPNYNGNGQSCNGAFYINKFNSLIDYLSMTLADFDPLVATLELISNFPPEKFLLEIGTDFLVGEESLKMKYVLSGNEPTGAYNPVAKVFFGEDLEDLAEASYTLAPNDVWEFYPTEFSIIPNTASTIKKYYFQFQGQNDLAIEFKSEAITLEWIPRAVFGKSAQDDLTDLNDVGLTSTSSALNLNGIVSKASGTAEEYFYMFIPKNVPAHFPAVFNLISSTNNLPVAVEALGEASQTVTSSGSGTYVHVYNVYRTAYASYGAMDFRFEY